MICEVQLLQNKLEGMDLGLTFSVDTDNFGSYEEIEVCENVPLDPVC